MPRTAGSRSQANPCRDENHEAAYAQVPANRAEGQRLRSARRQGQEITAASRPCGRKTAVSTPCENAGCLSAGMWALRAINALGLQLPENGSASSA
ncbi:hypothetical protein ADIAG_03940 [Paeniglutamicibacter gangotriensis Lz1y]|uniref:Uncharacterized protein n=1 Tax=Paeniglutamicibacter gangotriensis Lz1y TaxID=1276920 RepID=M7NEA1_9MICC|nr:hypothetical protein ADIAG_03940 [Paeniglutamicibacter gangotriensis Lz1y]